MNKYSICLMCLILAACGGGSGRSGNVDGPLTVGRSNARITPMISNSEYQIAQYVADKLGEDAADINTSRRTSIPKPTHYNIDYDTAREIIDLAETLANGATSESEIISLYNTDSRKIKYALKLLDNTDCFDGTSAEETATKIIARRTEFTEPLAKLREKTTVFNLKDVDFKTMITPHQVDKMQFLVDDSGKIKGIVFAPADGQNLNHIPQNWLSSIDRIGDNTFQTSNATMTYDSYAKNLGLKYTDFGAVGIDYDVDRNRGHFDAPFIAGYEQKRITDMPAGETVFVGVAKGTVEYAADTNTHLPIQDSHAQLIFNNSTHNETLNADFDNWYAVSITKNGDTITMNLETQHTEDDRYILTQTNKTYDYFHADYYGDNGVPSEATALFQYQEKINPELDVTDNNKTVYIGFGGKTE